MTGFKVIAQLIADALAANSFRKLRLLVLRESTQQQILFLQHQQSRSFRLSLLAPFFKGRQIVDTLGNTLIIKVENHLLLYQQVTTAKAVFQCLQLFNQFVIVAIKLAFTAIALFHQCLLNKDFSRFLWRNLAVDAVFVFNNAQAKQCLALFGHYLTGFFIVKGFAVALFD